MSARRFEKLQRQHCLRPRRAIRRTRANNKKSAPTRARPKRMRAYSPMLANQFCNAWASIGTNLSRSGVIAMSGSDLEQLARLGDARGGPAVFAGGNAGEGDKVSPLISRPGRGEFLGDGAIKLLGVQRTVFADG